MLPLDIKEEFVKIWDMALPYQDKRDDKGHARIVTEYTIKLCSIENAEDKIVVPAAILHDIGWSQLSKKDRFVIFRPDKTPEMEYAVRIKHQDEGVKLAEKILNKVGYPSIFLKSILEIISQHDTRKNFLSNEDGAMRDADKLWRYTKVGFDADLRSRECSFEFYYKRLEDFIGKENFFYFDSARDIAMKELMDRKEDCSDRIDIM